MDFITRAPHPLGTFDLAAIGIVLVVVMAVLALRRIGILRRRTRLGAETDKDEG